MRLTIGNWQALLDAAPMSCGRGPDQGLAKAFWANPMRQHDRTQLLSFAVLEKLTVDLFEYCGVWLAATILNVPTALGGNLTASGVGATQAAALVSCLGEAVELRSWLYQTADSERCFGTVPRGLPQIAANDVLGFSDEQYTARQVINADPFSGGLVPPFSALQTIDCFVEVSSFTRNAFAACPALLCFGRMGRGRLGDESLDINSSGCAAGADEAAARSKAVHEVCERDAVGLWWWRGCWRHRLAAPVLGKAELHDLMLKHQQESGRLCWFLDISVLDHAQTVVALSCDRTEDRVAMGFGCAGNVSKAARSAFFEMLQTELCFLAHDHRTAMGQDVQSADRQLAHWLAQVSLASHPFLAGLSGASDPAPSSDIHALLKELVDIGSPVWFADLQRPSVSIPVHKAIAPGLCHDKPRFGPDRLWRLPEAKGLKTSDDGRVRRQPIPLLV